MIDRARKEQHMRIIPLLIFATLALSAGTLDGQERRSEVLHLKDGRVITGPMHIEGDRVIVSRKLGEGRVVERYPFSRVEPNSLYGLVAASLQPLDRKDHRRLADLALDSGLFATAARHYRDSAPDEGAVPTELMGRIELAEKKDVERILKSCRADLAKEDFRGARRRALSGLKRYGERPEVGLITGTLEEISRAMAAAKRRRAALARTAAAKKSWDRHARHLLSVEKEIDKARTLETRALEDNRGLSASKRRYDQAIRYLNRADRGLDRFRRSRGLADELIDRAAAAEDKIIAMQIRLRLHLASLYSVRGSYGSAIGYTNQALAYDPTDQSALVARSRIEQAAAAASAARIIR
jgi:tetratricopeptide (TPR) repeat protein